MAANVVWLDQAKDELLAVLDYLQPLNSTAAIAYVREVEEACNKLADFPLQGRKYNENYRALVIRNHLIFYRYDDTRDTIVIVTIIDGRRDLSNLLG
jgi:plasmid stabilization system protein ParE